jgi:hypothetical protein
MKLNIADFYKYFLWKIVKELNRGVKKIKLFNLEVI